MIKRIGLLIATNLAVITLLGVVLAIAQSMGFNVNGVGGWVLMASIIGFGGAFFSLAISKVVAKWQTKAKVITSPSNMQEKWLFDTVMLQSQKIGLKAPEIAIYESSDANAFATGPSKNNSLVAVSTGLLSLMNKEEAEAVIAHELSHIKNGDMVTMTLLQGVLNTFVILLARVVGFFVDRVLLKNEGSGQGIGYFVSVIIAQLVLGVFASMIAMKFSRLREYRADAGSAYIVGKDSMIKALKKLQINSPQSELPKAIEAFGISGRFGSLLASHPTIEDRIASLEKL